MIVKKILEEIKELKRKKGLKVLIVEKKELGEMKIEERGYVMVKG